MAFDLRAHIDELKAEAKKVEDAIVSVAPSAKGPLESVAASLRAKAAKLAGLIESGAELVVEDAKIVKAEVS